MTREDFIRLQGTFYDTARRLPQREYEGLDHQLYKAEQQAYGLDRVIIMLDLMSFSQGLINSLNQFTGQLFKLETWKMVLDECDEETKLSILWGTVETLAQWLFAAPSNYRKKLIYCATMLLNDAYELLGGSLGSIKEADIGYKSLANHVVLKRLNLDASGLLFCIKNINTGLVNEYRNELNHRIPRNIEVGHSVYAVRHPSGKSVGLSGRSPLTLEEAIPLLIHEQRQMKAGFYAYWEFAKSMLSRLYETENA